MVIKELLSVIKELDGDMDIWINDDYRFDSIEIDFQNDCVTFIVPELREDD